MQWHERKRQLKRQLCAYFKASGADNKKLVQICSLLKKGIAIELEVAIEFEIDCLSKDSNLWGEIKSKFSPQTREKTWEFACDLFNLELEAAKYLEEQRYWRKSEHCWARDDFECEDYESQLPKGEIVISHDAAYVNLFEFWNNFSNQLPADIANKV